MCELYLLPPIAIYIVSELLCVQSCVCTENADYISKSILSFSVIVHKKKFPPQHYLFILFCFSSGNVGPRKETPSEIQWNYGRQQSSSNSALTFLECCWVCIRFVQIFIKKITKQHNGSFKNIWKTSNIGCNVLNLPQVPPLPCWVKKWPWPALWLWRRVFQNITTVR